MKSVACCVSGDIYGKRKQYKEALQMYKNAFVGKPYWGNEAKSIDNLISSKIDEINVAIKTAEEKGKKVKYSIISPL